MNNTNYQRLWPILLLGVVAVLEVAYVGSIRLAAMIDPDSAQLISAARNLMEGNGLTTSALYYEEQFALGPPPVPLTVWPPGLAVSAIPFLALGVSISTTAFLVSAIGHVACILLSYWLCRLAGLARPVAVAVGIAVACLAFSFTLMAAGYSEPTFTAATLASAGLLLSSVQSARPHRLLLASGAFATVAISFRYAGLAWLAAALATITVFNLRAGMRRLLLGWLALGALPIAFCAILFARNLADVGTLTGGPLLGGDSNFVEIARNSYWAVLRLFGATGNRLGILIVVAVVGALGGWLVWKVAHRVIGDIGFRADTSALSAGDRLCICALAYIGATAALLLYLSTTAYPGFVKERYLMPAVPFALLAAGVLLAELRGKVARIRAGGWIFAIAVLAVSVAYVIGQYRVFQRQAKFVDETTQIRVADALSRATVGKEPLLDYLQRTVSLSHPLIADRGQVLSAIIARPTIELPLPEYSRLTYDEPTVRALMQRMNSCLLLVHPATTAAATGDRRVLLKQLASGHRPAWLKEIMNDSGLLLLRAEWCSEVPAP